MFFETLSWALGRGVVTVSVDVYRRLGGFKTPRTTPFPCSRLSLPRRHVLYVGRLSPEKGVGDFLRVAIRLRECRFVVVGDGPLRLLAELAGRLPNIVYIGPVPRGGIVAFL